MATRNPKKVFGKDNPYYVDRQQQEFNARKRKIRAEQPRLPPSSDQGNNPRYRWDWDNKQRMVVPGEAYGQNCTRCSDRIGDTVHPGDTPLEPPQEMSIGKRGATFTALVDAPVEKHAELQQKYHIKSITKRDEDYVATWNLRYEEHGRPQDYSVEYMANRARYEGIPSGTITE